MKRFVLWLGIVLVFAAMVTVATRSRAQQRSQMGGRPGEFHFILKEQADYNRTQFREMQTRIARMRADVMASTTDEATRVRMLQSLDQLSLFITSIELQLTTPVGQTAGEVEQRLNYVKGEATCVLCHQSAARSTR